MNSSRLHQLRRRPDRGRDRPLPEPRAARARGRRARPALRLPPHRHRRARARRPRPSASSCAPPGTLGFSGLNITHPCKQLVVEHLDELSPDAEALGAVNTVVFDDGRAIGHNTDWPGFQENFARGLPDVEHRARGAAGRRRRGRRGRARALALGVERLAVVDAAAGARRGAGRLAAPGAVAAAASTTWPRELGARRRRRQRHARRHGGARRRRLLARPPAPERCGWPTSSTGRSRPSCCATPGSSAAARSTAAAWPSSRPRCSFALFTGREPDRERMLRHFAALDRRTAEVRACVRGSPPSA